MKRHNLWGKFRGTYQSWADMKRRCTNPKSGQYKNYGARGVTVCERWRVSFSAFFADIGERPATMTLERKDNLGNYEPINCVWADRATQRRNQRDCLHLTLGIVTKTAEEWSKDVGIDAETIRRRKRNGWSDYDAIQTPRINGNQHTVTK